MIHYRTKHDSLSSHQQIARIIKELHRDPILDVGSAQGILGQNLNGSGLVIDAIEPDPQCADAAQAFYRSVHRTKVEIDSLTRDHYRIIVCGDVLEHLADPTAALRRLREAATADATFIISVPNVAHISVRLMLLAGYFPRMGAGILDKTHLQFFSRATAQSMLAAAGLTVKKIIATPVPVEAITASRILNIPGRLFQHPFMLLRPTMFAFQWIFVAEPEEEIGK
jgi:2-polyprenyl-3-methyl-5-hydroxy-6-metoxy-1,4-benzoquinol methylase